MAAEYGFSGDCDSDGYVEPLNGALPSWVLPQQGGLIPLSIGVSKKTRGDRIRILCVGSWIKRRVWWWNRSGDNPAERLQGDNDSGVYSVVALISAGLWQGFTTTCRDFVTADVNADGDLEDPEICLWCRRLPKRMMILSLPILMTKPRSIGGLWSIKSGAPDTAVIGKKIETSGMASLQGGVLLPDSALITCDATTAGDGAQCIG